MTFNIWISNREHWYWLNNTICIRPPRVDIVVLQILDGIGNSLNISSDMGTRHVQTRSMVPILSTRVSTVPSFSIYLVAHRPFISHTSRRLLRNYSILHNPHPQCRWEQTSRIGECNSNLCGIRRHISRDSVSYKRFQQKIWIGENIYRFMGWTKREDCNKFKSGTTRISAMTLPLRLLHNRNRGPSAISW